MSPLKRKRQPAFNVRKRLKHPAVGRIQQRTLLYPPKNTSVTVKVLQNWPLTDPPQCATASHAQNPGFIVSRLNPVRTGIWLLSGVWTARIVLTPPDFKLLPRPCKQQVRLRIQGRGNTDERENLRVPHTMLVYRVSKQYAREGLGRVVNRKKRETPPVPAKVTGEIEAKIIAASCGEPSAGYSWWTLRLLEEKSKVVSGIELSDTTIGTVLKNTSEAASCGLPVQRR
jgi:hypothetical protein